MFRDDQPTIEAWARKDALNTLDVGTFVLLSIRQQFSGLGRLLQRVKDRDMAPLWGFKREGFDYLHRKRAYLHKRCEDARFGRIWVNDLMRDYLAVPGLGLVKAGFCVQLLTGEAGCMDMHNLERFGMNEREFNIPKRKDVDEQLREVDKAIENYLYTCDRYGGSVQLWDGWCHWVAETYSTYEDADDVSRRHVTYLMGESQ